MVRTRWFGVGFLVVAAVIGGSLNARGPFDGHPVLAYDEFLADFRAGNVQQIIQWRDQLELTEQGNLLTVLVPAERDVEADLAQARWASGVGISYTLLPDAWLGTMTPWAPILIAVAAVLIWITAIARDRRWRSRSSAIRSAADG